MSELLKILSKKIINERSWAFIIHQNEEKYILKMKKINAHNFFLRQTYITSALFRVIIMNAHKMQLHSKENNL